MLRTDRSDGGRFRISQNQFLSCLATERVGYFDALLRAQLVSTTRDHEHN